MFCGATTNFHCFKSSGSCSYHKFCWKDKSNTQFLLLFVINVSFTISASSFANVSLPGRVFCPCWPQHITKPSRNPCHTNADFFWPQFMRSLEARPGVMEDPNLLNLSRTGSNYRTKNYGKGSRWRIEILAPVRGGAHLLATCKVMIM